MSRKHRYHCGVTVTEIHLSVTRDPITGEQKIVRIKEERKVNHQPHRGKFLHHHKGRPRRRHPFPVIHAPRQDYFKEWATPASNPLFLTDDPRGPYGHDDAPVPNLRPDHD